MDERYSMTVRWSAEDKCFIALSAEWPGLSAFGPTREEAIKEAGIALSGFIEVARREKIQTPVPMLLDIRVKDPNSLDTANR